MSIFYESTWLSCRLIKKRHLVEFASEWKIDKSEDFVAPLTVDTLSGAIDRNLAGEMVGRGLVAHERE